MAEALPDGVQENIIYIYIFLKEHFSTYYIFSEGNRCKTPQIEGLYSEKKRYSRNRPYRYLIPVPNRSLFVCIPIPYSQ